MKCVIARPAPGGSVQQEALTRLLIEKRIFTKEELLETVKLVNQEMKSKAK
jgi:hypothetical protein